MKDATRVCSKQLAHDLLNQLSVIVGHCQLLSENTLLDPHFARYLERISAAANAMALKVKKAQKEPLPSASLKEGEAINKSSEVYYAHPDCH